MILQVCVALGEVLASKKALQIEAVVSDSVKNNQSLKLLVQHFGCRSARQQHASIAHTLFADSPEG